MNVTRAGSLLISQGEVKKLLSMHEANVAVDETFVGLGEGKVKNPTKVTLDLGQHDAWPDYDGYVNAMPAYIASEDIAGLKWVAGIGGKRQEAGLPYINALILLLDPKTGNFLAVMDGSCITNLRTGA